MVHKHCYTIYLENNHWQTLKWFAIYSDNVIILRKFELRSVIVSALFPILFNWLLEVSEWDEIKKTDIGYLKNYLFTYLWLQLLNYSSQGGLYVCNKKKLFWIKPKVNGWVYGEHRTKAGWAW